MYALADEAATLALATSLGVGREEELGSVQDVDEHGQLGLHERLQLVFEQLHDVLQTVDDHLVVALSLPLALARRARAQRVETPGLGGARQHLRLRVQLRHLRLEVVRDHNAPLLRCNNNKP